MGIRKCSHCGNIGHNSRTCNNSTISSKGGNNNIVRLFGVQLDISSSSSSSSSCSINTIKKSFSLDCLSSAQPFSSSSPTSSLSSSRLPPPISADLNTTSIGYLSDGHLCRSAVIDLSKLRSQKRSETMALLHEACEKWGFFMIENHDINKGLMEKVKSLMNMHYEENMKHSFYNSETAKSLGKNEYIRDGDWETTFFIRHHPNSNINDLTSLSQDLRKAMDEYIEQLIKLAEEISELMCENLGIEKSHIIEAFAGSKGPWVGTKVAMYPECPRPELIRGLREHTDAGGIILLLQDEQVPGLQFFKDGEWVKIPPSKNNRIFINTGDQIEILSNGVYKSALHRVMAMKDGNRLSIATFYNPCGDAVISPAPQLLLPHHIRFEDYLKLYTETKFGDKGLRFQSIKNMANGV